MASRRERSLEELYADDPERADAVVLGRRADLSRRGFLNGAGLAGIGAAVGAVGAVCSEHAGRPGPGRLGARARPPPERPGASGRSAAPRLSGQGEGPRRCSARSPWWPRRPSTCSTTRRRRRRKFFIRNNGQIPEAAAEPGRLEARRRRRGRHQARTRARRAQGALPAQDLPHGAGMRRQRPLLLPAPGPRQPVDQRRRRLRRVDRHPARRGAQGRRREGHGQVHRPLRGRSAPVGRHHARSRSRAACRSPRRWSSTASSCSP